MLESVFNKAASLRDYNFTKKRSQRRCFPVTFARFLRIPTSNNIRERLLLFIKDLKGYLRYKTIFCHKVTLDVLLTIFFVFLFLS